MNLRWDRPAPGFTLPSSDGREISLTDFRGTSDVVLVFYCYAFGSI